MVKKRFSRLTGKLKEGAQAAYSQASARLVPGEQDNPSEQSPEEHVAEQELPVDVEEQPGAAAVAEDFADEELAAADEQALASVDDSEEPEPEESEPEVADTPEEDGESPVREVHLPDHESKPGRSSWTFPEGVQLAAEPGIPQVIGGRNLDSTVLAASQENLITPEMAAAFAEEEAMSHENEFAGDAPAVQEEQEPADLAQASSAPEEKTTDLETEGKKDLLAVDAAPEEKAETPPDTPDLSAEKAQALSNDAEPPLGAVATNPAQDDGELAVQDRETTSQKLPAVLPERPVSPANVAAPDAETSMLRTPSAAAVALEAEKIAVQPAASGVTPSGKPGKRRRWGIWLLVLVVLLLGGGYIAAAVYASTTLPHNASLLGVDIGGRTRVDAQSMLELAQPLPPKQAVQVRVGEKEFTVSASRVFTLDIDASLQENTGFTLNPKKLYQHYLGTNDLVPVFQADRDLLKTEIADKAAATWEDATKVGTIEYEQGQPIFTPGKPGKGVNKDEIADRIIAKWPNISELTTTAITLPPVPSNEEMQAFAEGPAAKAVNGPLKVTASGKTYWVNAAALSETMEIKIVNDKPTIAVDGDALSGVIMSLDPHLITYATDARIIKNSSGGWTIIPEKDGSGIDSKELGKKTAQAVLQDREVTVSTAPIPAEVTAEYLRKHKPSTTVISEFRSVLPVGAFNRTRTHNVVLALKNINGTYVKPGQQFSLLRTLGGDLTRAKGYKEALTIQNNKHVPALGGGVSQVSTTIFNASWFAGVQLDEHMAHTEYFLRYPKGREATLWFPTVDNKWTNTTGEGIWIETFVEGPNIVMRYYGKKAFKVETHTGKPYNCTAKGAFTITVGRTVRDLNGKVVESDSFTTRYRKGGC